MEELIFKTFTVYSSWISSNSIADMVDTEIDHFKRKNSNLVEVNRSAPSVSISLIADTKIDSKVIAHALVSVTSTFKKKKPSKNK